MPKDSQNICDELKSTVVCHGSLILATLHPAIDLGCHCWLCSLMVSRCSMPGALDSQGLVIYHL